MADGCEDRESGPLFISVFDEVGSELLHPGEIPLATAEFRHFGHVEDGTGEHKRGHARLAQLARDFFGIAFALDEQHDAFALDGVGDGRDGEFGTFEDVRLADAQFHGGKRNHFATELRESAVASENLHESVGSKLALVARLVPAASINFEDDVVRLFLVLQVALHHLRAGNDEHAFFALAYEFVSFGVDDGGDRTGNA